MIKTQALWERLYQDTVYTAIVRAVGYNVITYRELSDLIETLGQTHGKTRVESACFHLVTFEGQNCCNVKPLAEVKLREEVRKLSWQLLGPPPEDPEYA